MVDLVLVIGHSHIGALNAAYEAHPGQCGRRQVAFLPLGGPAFTPTLRDGALHPAVRRMLAAPRLVAVVTAVGGNQHSAIGLSPGPDPFDTVLPEAPTLPLTPAARLLPFGLVRQVIARRSHDLAEQVAALRAATGLPMIQIESPPPIPSEEHLRTHAKAFAPIFARHGIAPAALRYKLWRANSAVMRAICADSGIHVLPVPPEMQDSDGMLHRKGWMADPTHANAAYGAAVLRQIARWLDALPVAGPPRRTAMAARS